MDKGRIEWGGDEPREDRYKYVLITPRITKFAVLVYLDLCRALDCLLKVIYSQCQYKAVSGGEYST